nr:helitron helicase-like domain-containing protein [Tanacetum cinerariifolium]
MVNQSFLISNINAVKDNFSINAKVFRLWRQYYYDGDTLASMDMILMDQEVCIQHIWTYSGGRVKLPLQRYSPEVIKELDRDMHFMEIIRAYNQMFAMTLFRAKVNDAVNKDTGPYVFKVKVCVSLWMGSFFPLKDKIPRIATILAMRSQTDFTIVALSRATSAHGLKNTYQIAA